MTNAETQLAGYFAKYEPAMAKLGKALRAKLRARLPGLTEIVYMYENQNALIAAAVKLAKLRLDPDAKGAMVLKAEEQKPRAGRATKAAAK